MEACCPLPPTGGDKDGLVPTHKELWPVKMSDWKPVITTQGYTLQRGYLGCRRGSPDPDEGVTADGISGANRELAERSGRRGDRVQQGDKHEQKLQSS